MLEWIKQKKLTGRFSTTDMGEVSLLHEMGVTRDRKKGTVAITQDNYTKSLLERYGMGNYNPTYTPGVESELSLDQPEEKLSEQGGQSAFSGHHGQRGVPRTGKSLRHPVLRRPTGEGDVHTFQGSHGGGQAPTSPPGQDNGLRHHV